MELTNSQGELEELRILVGRVPVAVVFVAKVDESTTTDERDDLDSIARLQLVALVLGPGNQLAIDLHRDVPDGDFEVSEQILDRGLTGQLQISIVDH